MLPSPSAIITALSGIRKFSPLKNPTDSTALGVKKYLASAGSAHLEITADADETIEVSLLASTGLTQDEQLQNTALMLHLLTLSLPTADSGTWFNNNIAAEERQPLFTNEAVATIVNPLEGVALLNIQALSETTGPATEEETPKVDPDQISQAVKVEPILEPIVEESDLDLAQSVEVSVEQLRELKLLLAEGLLTELSFAAIDNSESMAILQQAGQQPDPNLAVLMTTLSSVMSTNEVQRCTNAAQTQQIALKDQAIAQALTLLEQIIPSS